MKYILSGFLLSFFVLLVHAQDTVYTYKKKFKNGFQPKAFTSFSVYDEQNGNLHLTLVDNKSIERIIIDSNWKTLNHFSTIRGMYSDFPYDRFDNLQLVAINSKEFNIYNTDNKFFFVNEIDYNKEEEKRVQNFELKRKETLVEAFATSNIFCVIIAEKNADKLKFITNAKNNGTTLDTIIVNFDFINTSTNLAKQFENVSIIREDDRALEKLISKNKIYIKGHTVFISSDKLDATYITEVSLLTGEVKSKVFYQQYTAAKPLFYETAVYNSFLYNNILVNGYIYKDELTITFYDYENGKLINKFNVPKNGNIDFSSGPLLNRKGKEISSKEFFKRALKEENIIFEMNKNDQGNIEFGVAVCNIRAAGGALMPLGLFPSLGGFFIGFTFGGAASSYTYYTKDANFKSYLDEQTLQVTKNESNFSLKPVPILLQEEYEKLALASCTALSIFKNKGNIYIGFYNQDSQSYYIKRVVSAK